MEVFKYTKLVSETGKNSLIVLTICALIAAFFLYKTVTKTGENSQLTTFVIITLVVFCLVAGKEVITRLGSTGSWKIIIDERKLQWNAPEGIDKSFSVELDQISQIVKTLEKDQNDSSYHIEMRDGTEISLNKTSEMNFDYFIDALEKRGIQYKVQEDRAYQ